MLGYVALKLTPDWFASEPKCRAGDKACLDVANVRADNRRDVTTATLALFAGALSVFGAIYTARTFALNRKSAAQSHALDRAGQITERFTRAIDQLGSASLDVRLGGIYALERIARDSADDHPQVVEVLTAYVREHAPGRSLTPNARSTLRALAILALRRRTKDSEAEPHAGGSISTLLGVGSSANSEAPQVPTDVQAALTVLGRRDSSRDRPGARLNLVDTDLPRAILGEANLQHAILGGANLQRARLRRANLEHAWLHEANFEHADLLEANLEHADLLKANLEHAQLSNANLQEASLDGTNLQHAVLGRANLQHARLNSAYFRHAYLGGANLEHADLGVANLEDADLGRANLRNAQLIAANLRGADLRAAIFLGVNDIEDANLQDARYDAFTRWPDRFDPKAAGAIQVDEDDEKPTSVAPSA